MDRQPSSARASTAGTAALDSARGVYRWLCSLREGLGVHRGPERFRSLVQNAPDIVMLVGPDSCIRYVNDSVTRVLGYRPEVLLGQRLDRYLHPSDREGTSLDVTTDFRGTEYVPKTLAFRMRGADGHWCCVEANVVDWHRSVRSHGQRVYYIRDASERNAEKLELERRASEDPLTGLANRSLFMTRLKYALSGKARHRRPVAVLFLDMDDFKAVNDGLGHGVGDRLLVTLGQRLRACIRPEDTAARLGGDEFTVLMEDATGSNPVRLAERLQSILEEPVAFDGLTISVSLSIGVAVDGTDRGDADKLVHAADAAMYRAKQAGNGYYVVSDNGTPEQPPRRSGSGGDLWRALERPEFEVCYQPVVPLGIGGVVSMEALVRWKHPELGLLRPETFVPPAERNGLMAPIGRRLLQEACEQATEWQDLGPAAPAFITVSLSARQSVQPDLAEQVADVLRETGHAPDELVLEIPEDILVDGHRVAGNLQKLRDMGVKLTIRDFGTGYCPLSGLISLPVHALKIDRSLVGALRSGANEAGPTVSAIVRVARALDIETVAEGVESGEQTAKLKDMGCDAGQGSYFSKPLRREAATEFLAAATRRSREREPTGPSTSGGKVGRRGARRTGNLW